MEITLDSPRFRRTSSPEIGCEGPRIARVRNLEFQPHPTCKVRWRYLTIKFELELEEFPLKFVGKLHQDEKLKFSIFLSSILTCMTTTSSSHANSKYGGLVVRFGRDCDGIRWWCSVLERVRVSCGEFRENDKLTKWGKKTESGVLTHLIIFSSKIMKMPSN